jgi:putative tricarboxylic transport membrane protein
MFIGLFGLCGYALIKFGFEPAPLLLGFVLGKLMEENLRRALIISRGDMMTFISHSVSAALLFVAAVVLLIALLPSVSKGREEVFVED